MIWVVILVGVQLVIFAVLITVFRKIMNQNVVSATKHLDSLNADYQEKEKKVTIELERSKLQAQETVAQAEIEANAKREEILEKTQKEKEDIVAQARSQAADIIQQADKSRNQLLVEIEERILKEAGNRASQLIQQALPDDFKKMAHERWVDDILASGMDELKSLKVPQGIGEVQLVSAYELGSEQKKKVFHLLKSVLGENIQIKEEVDDKIIAGIVVKIGSLVLDASLKNKIREKSH